MKTLLRVPAIVLILLGLVLLFERPAYAYVDPGTGLLAIQAVGSALAAGGWYLRRRIVSLLRRDEPAKLDPVKLPIPEDAEGSPLQ